MWVSDGIFWARTYAEKRPSNFNYKLLIKTLDIQRRRRGEGMQDLEGSGGDLEK